MRQVATEENALGTPIWGIVDANFTARTGLTGEAIVKAIEATPGQDVYFTNPSPHIEGLFLNGWQQGYTVHPDFLQAVSSVFHAAGIDASELDRLEPSAQCASGHCVFGNAAFWSAYIDFVEDLLARARGQLNAETLAMLDSQRADPRKIHRGATYWHFIIERLLPLFLRGAGRHLKAHKFVDQPRDEALNSHQRRLREMKDVAHRTKSAWMHSCWLHYRNLYLLQVAGKKWCEAHLPALSKAEIRFE